MKDYGKEIVDRITVQRLMEMLTPEQQEIVRMWIFEGRRDDEIGAAIGRKYRGGKQLKGSAMRYHKRIIVEKLRNLAGDLE